MRPFVPCDFVCPAFEFLGGVSDVLISPRNLSVIIFFFFFFLNRNAASLCPEMSINNKLI